MSVANNSYSRQFIGDGNKSCHQLYCFCNVPISSVAYNICSYESWHTIFAFMNHGKFHSLDVCSCIFHMSYWEAVRACTELNVRWNQHKCLIAWNKPNQGWGKSLYSKPVSMSNLG